MRVLSGQPKPQYQVRAGDGPNGSQAAARRSVQPSANHEQALFRLDVRRSLQMHRRLALTIAILGIAAAALYLFTLWPVYTAQALVYVQPDPPKVMDQGTGMRWPFDANTYESFIQQQMLAVTRPDVMTGALKKLGPGPWIKNGESEQGAAERLQKTIEVARLGTSYQFSITAHASDPATAAKLSNAVAASYIEGASREARAGDAERLAMLREERDRVQRELGEDRAEQQTLNQQLGVAAVGGVTPDSYDDDIARTREELVKARTAHDEAATRLTTMGGGHAASSAALDADAEELIAGDPGLISLKTTLNQRRAALTSQMSSLTPANPQYKQGVQELAQIDASLEGMMKDLRGKATVRIQQRLRNDLERTSGVESQLNAQLGHMAAVAGGATPKMQRASDLAADISRLQNRYTTVNDLWRNMLLESSAPGAAFLSTAAVPPLHSFKSGVLRNTLLIAFAGLVFSVMGAVAAHKMDKRVYIASDLEQVLGFAPMAVLPHFVEVSDEAAEEHILRLSAGIEYAHQQGNLKSCIFTGAGQGVGVTTVVTRVRSVLETMGKATVLVDASGAMPPQHFGSEAAGSHDSNGFGNHRGSRSIALVQRLAEEAETDEQNLVLTDTAPLAVSAETEYLARFVDAAIVVVESGVTTRAQLRDVANTLQRLDVSAVGFVLNRVVLSNADPAFRQSVKAIEDHLRAQSRSYSRGTESSHANGNGKPGVAEQELRREAPFETATAEPEASVAPPVSAVHELPASSAAEVLFPPRSSRAVCVEEPARRESVAPPAWPSRHFAEEVEPEPAAPRQETPAPPPVREDKPVVASQPTVVPETQAEPAEPVDSEETQVFTTQPAISAPEAHAPTPPAQSWERVSSSSDAVAPEIAAEPAREEEPSESANSAASRLGGLRNLLFSVGLKNMSQGREAREAQEEYEQPIEEEFEETVPARTFTPIPDLPAQAAATVTSPRLVTAPPEFLPPRPEHDSAQKGHSWSNPATSHRDRRDSFDEVEILPSWRGQYKKK